MSRATSLTVHIKQTPENLTSQQSRMVENLLPDVSAPPRGALPRFVNLQATTEGNPLRWYCELFGKSVTTSGIPVKAITPEQNMLLEKSSLCNVLSPAPGQISISVCVTATALITRKAAYELERQYKRDDTYMYTRRPTGLSRL